ncbi:uncharacterized protein EV420DRAFT_940395 [Desarmillaria tabescens]|uniref:Secreted protein n=1 Tax=Armillaria tabescens TaxID=1929756 RepID=A0AA39NGJ7_ARMTA|nr:uncharacterized protein EV420DRAFT_940395 [Desarmillaria tabescens]KAK0465124.1 hypothetical protein EV420DRAFT_940395 [Desarmillaria tabescens]
MRWTGDLCLLFMLLPRRLQDDSRLRIAGASPYGCTMYVRLISSVIGQRFELHKRRAHTHSREGLFSPLAMSNPKSPPFFCRRTDFCQSEHGSEYNCTSPRVLSLLHCGWEMTESLGIL